MMKLHTVFVTHNRLELTKQAVESYLATVTVPFTYLIVDNFSSDGTQEWLADHPSMLLDKNYYPGYACNRGWEQAPRDADLLQRADNDMAFVEGWCEHIIERFKNVQRLGQLGLRTDAEEFNAPDNVGGNCVLRRKLWDRGLRYDEKPWTDYPPGISEDSYFSPQVRQLGFQWSRVQQPCL